MRRDPRPIALGTWSDRLSPPPEVLEDAFGPTDTMPLSMFSPSRRSREPTFREGGPGDERSLATYLQDMVAAQRFRQREKEAFLRERARSPRWSVTGGSVAALRYLNRVSRYCLGMESFDDTAQVRLGSVAPEVAEAALRLVAEQRRMHSAPLLWRKDEARSLMGPALRAAQEVQFLVASSFRPLPRPARARSARAFLIGTWKHRALEAAVREHDEAVDRWYGFVFVDPVSAGPDQQLETLGDELGVRPRTWRCLQDRQVCLDLAAAPTVSTWLVSQGIRSLEKALREFEEEAYSVLTRHR